MWLAGWLSDLNSELYMICDKLEVFIYDIIYADPPWSYYNDMTVSADCTTDSGVRRPPYPVMSSKEIEAIHVSKITNRDDVI